MSLDRHPHALALTGQVSKPLGCLEKPELLLQVEENRAESELLHPKGMLETLREWVRHAALHLLGRRMWKWKDYSDFKPICSRRV